MPKQKINNVEIYYELKGEGNEYVAFLNGIGMTVNTWQPFAERFFNDYKCLFHDARGQLMTGNTEGEYSMEQHVEDFKQLLDFLEIDKIHVVGTSYGSEISMIFAYTYPERVKTLCVIDGVSETDELMRRSVKAWQQSAKDGLESYFACVTPWVYSNTFLQNNKEFFDNRVEQVRDVLSNDYFTGFVKLCDSFLKLDITKKLKKIKCPTLVITGELDLIKTVKFGKIIADNIPGAEFIILEDTGHAAVIERPDEVFSLLSKFIKEK